MHDARAFLPTDLHVFVYGTLRHGEINDIAVAAARHRIDAPMLLGQARIAGQLYDFGDWPGLLLPASPGASPLASPEPAVASVRAVPPASLVPPVVPVPSVLPVSPSGAVEVLASGASLPQVVGDVYRIRAELLPVLDEIEGIRANGRDVFYRDVCAIVLAGESYRCQFYPVDRDAIAGLPLIVGGDWSAYRSARAS